MELNGPNREKEDQDATGQDVMSTDQKLIKWPGFMAGILTLRDFTL